MVKWYWPLRYQTRSASAIQFPPPTPTMVPNIRGLVIVDTHSDLVFEQLVKVIVYEREKCIKLPEIWCGS